MISIGIDPGKTGGIAVITDEGAAAYPFSDALDLGAVRVLKSAALKMDEGETVRVCLEKVGAMPGQGVTSMFNFGQSFGYVQGVLRSLQIPYQLVPPQTWKKEFTVTSDKNTSIAVCQKLFPGVSLLATERCRTPHDGMAEALLMAEYARRKL